METPSTKDREKFLEGMRYTASAVNIVTTDGSAGKAGVTVSAMTPVSADGEKPTLLVCVHHLSPACKAILANKVFGVNILSQKQSFIADTFAGRIKAKDNDKFSCTEWINGKTGVPLVLNSLVSFECQLLENTRVGSHHIFIGGVQNTRFQKDELPLIYSNRAYGSPAKIDIDPNHEQDKGGSPLLRIGCLTHLAATFIPELVACFLQENPDINFSLLEGNQDQLLLLLGTQTCDIAFLNKPPPNTKLNEYTLTRLNHYAVLPSEGVISISDSVTLEKLKDLPLLHLENSIYPDLIDLFGSVGITPKPKVQAASMEMILDMVERGLGYTVLATLSAHPLPIRNRNLRALQLPDQAGKLVMVTPGDAVPSKFAMQFLEFSKNYFTTRQ